MLLTRLALNRARRGTQRLTSSPQRMHAAVLESFPPGSRDESDGRILWRVDRGDTNLILYVLSPTQPDLTHVVEQAGWPTLSTWETINYLPMINGLADGQTWRFRLQANPVKYATDAGKIVPHLTAAQQIQWLIARAESRGFQVPLLENGEPAVQVSDRQRISFRRGEGTVTLATARFDGILEIKDSAVFRNSIANGIGRAKGYGCGLLTLARSSL